MFRLNAFDVKNKISIIIFSGLEVVHSGGCAAAEVSSIYPSRTEVCALAHGCFEWNPVCGKNNVTYMNPYVFNCYAPRQYKKSIIFFIYVVVISENGEKILTKRLYAHAIYVLR